MLGHLISDLILFAPVPAQLNLKEVHVQVALGGSCFKTLKSGPSRNPSYIRRKFRSQTSDNMDR